VGLTLVEPPANVDVNVPGVIAILVAPLVAQLSVVLVPEFMVAGLAPNDEMAGTEPPCIFDEPARPAQPLIPNDTRKSIASPKRLGPQRLGPKEFAQTGRRLRKLPIRPNSPP
jgi:hypothetical protein